MRRSIVASVVLVLALSACGSGKQSAVALVAGSTEEAFIAGSARIVGHATLTRHGEHITVPLNGVTDFQSGAADLKVDIRAMGLGGRGTVVEARVLDRVMYMDFGALLRGRRLPSAFHGKRWVKMDLRKLGVSGSDSTMNTSSLLESLRGAGDVRRVGTEKIRGVETTHFVARIDVRAAVSKINDRRLRALAKKGLAMMGDTFPMNVWLDEDGRPRRMALEFSLKGASMSETVDYVDFGVDAYVVAPPKSQTIDIAELRSSADTSTN